MQWPRSDLQPAACKSPLSFLPRRWAAALVRAEILPASSSAMAAICWSKNRPVAPRFGPAGGQRELLLASFMAASDAAIARLWCLPAVAYWDGEQPHVASSRNHPLFFAVAEPESRRA
jgi:hypothetical protein